jgi:hypothetical protein
MHRQAGCWEGTYVEIIENITDRVWEEGHRRGSSSKQRLGIGRYGRRRRTTRQLRCSKTVGASKIADLYQFERSIYERLEALRIDVGQGWLLINRSTKQAGLQDKPQAQHQGVTRHTNLTSTSSSTAHTANPHTIATPEPMVVIKLTYGR